MSISKVFFRRLSTNTCHAVNSHGSEGFDLLKAVVCPISKMPMKKIMLPNNQEALLSESTGFYYKIEGNFINLRPQSAELWSEVANTNRNDGL